ncbi:motile sperm domain-containing protein 2 isoform X2 [Empidonax traillii]|uniref:motile sperm domain-containing protein 2 isoform X2 n=1 Tax=Empidonax traillii TaxID=164674 RepID=UPI000FFD0A0E|nr:motile sperm domain-containing protein 2 isoform X2 [Empidonax traillii]
MAERQDKAALISETRRRFEAEYLPDKSDKYDSRDVERLQQDDKWVESYLIWRHDVVDDTLKMIDESFQWRKEYTVNDLSESVLPKWLFEIGALFLHGYDKEGYKLFWFKVKHHTRDPKQQLDKKKLVAFWLEHYAKRDHGKPLTVVFDMAETGISHIDLDFVRFIVNCFTDYYPNFLTKIVIFEMPWIMNAAFKIVKGWLGPDAISMLKFTNKSDIQEYISGEYLPPHMGGTDSFKYSYPPLVDDDFQTPLCENGPITNEDEHESKEELDADTKETGELSEAQNPNQKKMNSVEHISKSEESDKTEVKPKNAKKALTTFKGPLLHISPAEELYFGSKETGEKKCLIVLTNVTKNVVAFKVRTTAPEKYRVKPSNSSCEPGTSLDIIVSLHGGFSASLQDRFLIMAAEMDQSSGAGAPELTQFWKDVPRTKVMEHRLRCHVIESSKPSSLTLKDNAFNVPAKTNEDLHIQLTRLLQINKRLDEQMNRCLWFQQLSVVLSLLSVTVSAFCFYLAYAQRS